MDAKEIKMRVVYESSKAKMKVFAEALGEAFKCLVDACPPGHPCDKERLVILGLTCKGDPSDKLRRFCSELNTQRAFNVALFVDGEKDNKTLKMVKEILKDAGTNVIDNDYYVDGGGFFSKKISLDERTNIVRWVQGIVDEL